MTTFSISPTRCLTWVFRNHFSSQKTRYLPEGILCKCFVSTIAKNVPDSFQPCLMFGFHENGTEAGDDIAFRKSIVWVFPKKCYGQLYKREVEIGRRGLIENALGATGAFRKGIGHDLPYDYIEFGANGGEAEEAAIGAETAVKFKRSAAGGGETLRKFAAGYER